MEEEGLDAVISGAILVEKEPPPVITSEEKKPVLTLEELEAKQGKYKKQIKLIILSSFFISTLLITQIQSVD